MYFHLVCELHFQRTHSFGIHLFWINLHFVYLHRCFFSPGGIFLYLKHKYSACQVRMPQHAFNRIAYVNNNLWKMRYFCLVPTIRFRSVSFRFNSIRFDSDELFIIPSKKQIWLCAIKRPIARHKPRLYSSKTVNQSQNKIKWQRKKNTQTKKKKHTHAHNKNWNLLLSLLQKKTKTKLLCHFNKSQLINKPRSSFSNREREKKRRKKQNQ